MVHLRKLRYTSKDTTRRILQDEGGLIALLASDYDSLPPYPIT